MIKIGHRGAAAYIAENTIESMEKALEMGVDGIEIDVHLCASGELVVFHDLTLDRMTNGSGEISSWTLDELKVLRVGDKYRIPTLIEVLDIINARCILNIELKGVGTATKTCEIIKSYIKKRNYSYNHFIVSSFQYKELQDVYQIDESIPLGVLTKASMEEAIDFGNTVKAQYIHPNTAIISEKIVREAHELGYKVIAWTANMNDTIARMKRYGVDGIISDKPDRL